MILQSFFNQFWLKIILYTIIYYSSVIFWVIFQSIFDWKSYYILLYTILQSFFLLISWVNFWLRIILYSLIYCFTSFFESFSHSFLIQFLTVNDSIYYYILFLTQFSYFIESKIDWESYYIVLYTVLLHFSYSFFNQFLTVNHTI